MLRFFYLVFFIYSANSASAPFITKCKRDDNKCLKEAVQNAIPTLAAGLPELGVETLDPIFLNSLDASSKGLSLKLKDLSATGLKDCVVKKAQRDTLKSKLILKLQCTVDVHGKYEINGQLLILPIQGKGDAHVVLRNVVITVDSDLDEINGSDGQKHWKVKGHKFSYDLKDKSTIELQDLFNGNEVLARAARELINSSSNEVVKEIGTPIIKAVVVKVVKNIDIFFKNVPYSDLSLD